MAGILPGSTVYAVNWWRCQDCEDLYTAGPGDNLGEWIWWHQLYFHDGQKVSGRFGTFSVLVSPDREADHAL